LGVDGENGLSGEEPKGFVTPESGVTPGPSGAVSGVGLGGGAGGVGGGTMGAEEGPVNHGEGAEPPPSFWAETRPANPAPTRRTAAVLTRDAVTRDGVRYERRTKTNLDALKCMADREGNG
jgi:hypothetical protein